MAAFAVLCVGCQKEDVGGEALRNENTFTASFESNETRAYLDEEDYCRWELNDQVSLFNNDGDHYIYYSVKGDVTTTQLNTNESPEFAGENIYAIFPYCEANSIVNGTWNSVIPAEQAYNKEKVDMNNAIMVSKTAVAPKKHFSFKNSCALVKVELNTLSNYVTGEDAFSVNSITLSSKSENLAGAVMIADDFVAKVAEDGAKSVTLKGCGEAGQMTTGYKRFVLVIPAGTYVAGDLTISIDATNDEFDFAVELNKTFTIGRSEYITLHTTLTKSADRLVNKAIMADIPKLEAQGFSNICTDVLLNLPTGSADTTIVGDGKVYDFVTESENGELVYIMNTFTTSKSGIKNAKDAPKVTVNDITITGTLRGTSMGVYVPTYKNQIHFSTVFNNVNIVNNNIVPWTNEEGAGLVVFGVAELNNCSVYGTRYTEEYKEASQALYDVSVRNRAILTVNGGKYGFVHVKEHGNPTFGGGATIDKILSVATKAGNLGHLVINDAVVEEVTVSSAGSSQPQCTISKDAKITTLKFVGVTDFSAVTIANDANIAKIDVGGTVYTTIADFKEAVGK